MGSKTKAAVDRSLRRKVFGLMKIQKLRLQQQLRTHHRLATKKRSVATDFDLEWVRCRTNQTGERRILYEELRREVEWSFRRFTSDEQYRELLRLRIFHGESIKQSAEDLQLVYQSCRRLVMKARKFLRSDLNR